MESTYDLDAWASETTHGRRLFNYNYMMSGRELAGWQLSKAVPTRRDRSLSAMTYLWQSEDLPDLQVLRVDVAELPDWRAAQRYLKDVLSHCMRPDLPRGTMDLAEIGDVEFVARAGTSELPAAVDFVRGNVAIGVKSVGSVDVDVSGAATKIDRALTGAPSQGDFAERLEPTTLDVGNGDVRIVAELERFVDRWLKVIVSDGELRRTGDAIVYASARPGAKFVEIFSINWRAYGSVAIGPTWESLEQRERDLLRLLRMGLENSEIADRLATPEELVDFYITILLQRLGLTSRAQLAMWYPTITPDGDQNDIGADDGDGH